MGSLVGVVAVDEGGEGGDVGEGGVYFLVLFFEHDAEVFVEEDGDFEDVDGVEAEAVGGGGGFSKDGGGEGRGGRRGGA